MTAVGCGYVLTSSFVRHPAAWTAQRLTGGVVKCTEVGPTSPNGVATKFWARRFAIWREVWRLALLWGLVRSFSHRMITLFISALYTSDLPLLDAEWCLSRLPLAVTGCHWLPRLALAATAVTGCHGCHWLSLAVTGCHST